MLCLESLFFICLVTALDVLYVLFSNRQSEV